MRKQLIKEKRIYFLFSKIHTKDYNKTHLSLIVDTFINNQNNFLSIFEISKKLKRIGIIIQSEALISVVDNESCQYLFYNIPQKIEEPFKLKDVVFKNYSAYENYTNKLSEYIDIHVKNSQASCEKENIMEILLKTIFNRNLNFLKQLLKSSDVSKLENFLILDGNEYSNSCYESYNNMILDSGDKLNEIIKVLLYKVFDFLKLHYNPNIDTTLNQHYKNKIFYLDSSFILRLFGFDNEIRQIRSEELINILKDIEGVKFIVHNKTISEAQYRINELIDKVYNLIGHNSKTIKSFSNIDGKGNNTIDLYLRLKDSGKISNRDDFKLYYTSVLNRLKAIISPTIVQRDDKKIRIKREKENLITKALEFTDKTQGRIKKISRLLLHIDELRGSNNYNIFDIKYWLLTTDNTTLKIDANLRKIDEEDNSKSVCILPTELLRTISNRSEVSEDYMEVFKKFMLYSNVYREEYSDLELESIETILSLAENANQPEYEVDYYIDELFNEISLKELLNRIDKLDQKRERDLELIKIFQEKFDGRYKKKYLSILKTRKVIFNFFYEIFFFSAVWFVPLYILFFSLFNVINPKLDLNNPLTYINEEAWGKLEGIVIVIELVLIPLAFWAYRKYRLRLRKLLSNYLFKDIKE